MTTRTAVIFFAASLAVFASIGVLVGWKAPAIPQQRFKPALGGWIPPSLDPKPAGVSTWRFEFPTETKALPIAPLNEPHIVLNLGRPMPIRSLRLEAEPGAAFKAWITLLEDDGKERLVPLGEAKGADVELVVPPMAAEQRVTSLRLSYKPGPRGIATFAAVEPAVMSHETGKCYLIALPEAVGESDDNDHPARSTLVMLENGKPLKSAHAIHGDIRKLGDGRYSHWGHHVMFSSSDGTDPRTNGRKYTIAKPKQGEIRLQVS